VNTQAKILLAMINTLLLTGQCHLCVDAHSGQKNFQTADINADIEVSDASQGTDGNIHIRWLNDLNHLPAGHQTVVSPHYLNSIKHSHTRVRTYETKPWSGSEMRSRLKWINYEQYMNDEDTLHDGLRELQQTGLLFLRGVPDQEKSVEDIGERIGPLKHTFYGRTWDVRDKPKAENVAYTSHFLGMHMDLL